MAIKILEVCHVTPSHGGAAAEKILPLLYFDVAWIPSPPSQTLYFYDFHHNESHFLDTIVPNLKNSLSLTLKHFLPLAGKIVFPLSSGLPFSHYKSWEDSVSLTIAISDSDFSHLTGNHLKNAAEFHDLISQLPAAVHSHDSIEFAVLAVRVTLFPSHGVCIGVTHHHAICDATSLIGPSGFLQTWASINKLDGDLQYCKDFLPSYNRSSIAQDSHSLTTSFWCHIRLSAPVVHPTFPLVNLRGTFVLSKIEIQSLKDSLLSQTPVVGHVSSYVAVTAHVWSCLAAAAAAAAAGEKVDEDEPEYLSLTVECRGRLTPPLPAQSTHGLLKDRAGFLAAARAISAAIKRSVGNERGVVAGVEAEYLRRRELVDKRLIGVSGSHRFDLRFADYGWGEVRKFEILHIDYSRAMSLFKSKQGIEVGLSMPNPKMDAFAAIFKKNLCITSNL